MDASDILLVLRALLCGRIALESWRENGVEVSGIVLIGRGNAPVNVTQARLRLSGDNINMPAAFRTALTALIRS